MWDDECLVVAKLVVQATPVKNYELCKAVLTIMPAKVPTASSLHSAFRALDAGNHNKYSGFLAGFSN